MEVVYFEGVIVGLGQRTPCRVRAVRTVTVEHYSTDSGHAIIEDAKTDELPDGDYNIQIDGKPFTFERRGGKFGLGQPMTA
jgi:hypothetical protein